MKSLSVIVMAYNEEGSIEKVVCEINEVLRSTKIDYEIVIINDGSIDETAYIASRLEKEIDEVRVVTHKENEGLGGVYRTGFYQARKKYITFFPADGQYPPSVILHFLNEISDNDMILGFLENNQRPPIPSLLSAGERLLYGILFGRIPRFQGIMLVNCEILEDIELKSTGRGWAIVLELIIRSSRKSYRIKSIPTTLRPRISGKSKVNNLKTILDNFTQALILRRYL